MSKEFDREWHTLSEEILTGMKEWRLQHPRATLKEMEQALHERMARLEARMLQDMALASKAADLSELSAAERPVCPHCGARLGRRGKRARHLQTQGGAEVVLERDYVVCPHCERGFFPPGRGVRTPAGEFDPSLAGVSNALGELDAVCESSGDVRRTVRGAD